MGRLGSDWWFEIPIRRTSVTLPNGIVGTYAFDNANQLSGISYAHGATTIGTLAYAYDIAGRVTGTSGTLAGFATPSSVASMTYDGTNRVTSWAGSPMTYDANGSLTGFGAASYTWNARNQLVATSAGSGVFAYDALGRRVSATVNGAATPYLYDGLNPATIAGNVMLASDNLDELFAQITSSTTTSYLRDGLNSTTAVTSSSASITGSYDYSPYGDSVGTGSGTTAQQFTGRDNDGATGLYYYRARYYSPTMGRFISEDPIGLEGGTNFYAYADGDPIDFTDPTGLLVGGLINAGESYGDEAAQYWADLAVQTGNPLYNIPGAIAALWTPCTSDKTAATLLGAYGVRVFGPFSPRGVPRFLARWRQYIRFDPPQHGKGWEFDGTIPKWLRNQF